MTDQVLPRRRTRAPRSQYVSLVLRPRHETDLEIWMAESNFREYHLRVAPDDDSGNGLCGVYCDWNTQFSPRTWNTDAPVQESWCHSCLYKAGGMKVLMAQDGDMRDEPKYIRQRKQMVLDGQLSGEELAQDMADHDDDELDWDALYGN